MIVKLGDICTIVSGSTPKSTHAEYWDGEYNWITPAELNDDASIIYTSQRKITEQAINDSHLKSFPAGTVLLSSRAPIGKVAIAGVEMYCNQGFKNLICSERVWNKYLFWFLKSKTEYLNSLGRGATFKEISKEIVSNIEIPLSDFAEQQRIATILDNIASLIDLHCKQMEKLDELVKSRFIELFGTETEMGRWETTNVGDVADVCVGVVIKPSQYYCTDGIPAFRSLNIGKMQVKDSDWVFFTPEGHQKNQKSVIRENDVLVVRSGAPGTACVATEKYDGFNAIDIIIAHPDTSRVNSVFLAMFTNMPHGMNQIQEKTGGAAQQHFNVGGYKSLQMILPPMAMQEQFAVFVEQTDKSKLAVQKSLDELETLKKSLMQQYFG